MNRNALIIAMGLSLPAFIIGCTGVKDSNSLSEQSQVAEHLPLVQPESEPVLENPGMEAAAVESAPEESTPDESAVSLEIAPAELTTPENEVTEAELVEAEQEENRAPAVAEPDMPQPAELKFFFASNDTRVKQEDYEKLIAHAEYLIKHPDTKLTIAGHTDQSGPTDYNQQLAEKRARAVAEVLIEYGVQAAQIETRGYGEDYPTTALEHAIYDRRVELEYSQLTRVSENSF